eukprot:CAMPEP_0202800998 /NCGR_PEP_ID=MMETSP1388-20130828/101622_1 /ASSEMBLY_ACC=CAM_ASM_000864 /TAXON_ID=37098 /ORGANISM="Isochrysis sp, Strain CCMP1244" /LENGTH=99 /DNA_ID=CAMNT_0049470987 /DNA_START=202 /DNA_END=497 /DNA_ORIENTATION=-
MSVRRSLPVMTVKGAPSPHVCCRAADGGGGVASDAVAGAASVLATPQYEARRSAVSAATSSSRATEEVGSSLKVPRGFPADEPAVNQTSAVGSSTASRA